MHGPSKSPRKLLSPIRWCPALQRQSGAPQSSASTPGVGGATLLQPSCTVCAALVFGQLPLVVPLGLPLASCGMLGHSAALPTTGGKRPRSCQSCYLVYHTSLVGVWLCAVVPVAPGPCPWCALCCPCIIPWDTTPQTGGYDLTKCGCFVC